ncbi:MAG: hypothetical protein U0166_20825 [Acidobacteriota bacterium]
MKKRLSLLLSLSIAAPVIAWQAVDWRGIEHWPITRFGKPKFSVSVERDTIPQYALFRVRTSIENPGSEPLLTLLSITNPIGELHGDLSCSLKGPDSGARPLAWSKGEMTPSPGYLAAKERLSREDNFGYLVAVPGQYAFRVSYQWRPNPPGSPDPAPAFLVSDVPLHIEAPAGVDKEAFDFVGDPELLLVLQQAEMSYYPMQRDVVGSGRKPTSVEVGQRKDVAIAGVQVQRKEFLARFARSSYAPDVQLALARQLQKDGKLDEARAAFDEYVRLYPGAWSVPEATLASAECLLDLGKPDDAGVRAGKVLERSDLSEPLRAMASRMKRGLERGAKSSAELAAAPLYEPPVAP